VESGYVETGYVAPPPPPVYVPRRQVVVSHVAPSPERRIEHRETRGDFLPRFELVGNVQGVGYDAAASGVRLIIDGRQLGLETSLQGFVLPSMDYIDEYDRIRLLNAQLTMPVVDGARGRLRLTGGATAVFAPDVTMVGPTVGSSLSLRLVGPFTADAHLAVTPWPFIGVDSRVGVGLQAAFLKLELGYRATYLDDRGEVDGYRNTDLFVGPYFGLGVVF
jgi:hypothetical protein